MTTQTTQPIALSALDTDALRAAADRLEPGVGFVGCGRSGRVLRVRVASRRRMHMRVECPHGCGEHGTTTPMVRPLGDGEPEPELAELPPADAPTSPAADNPAPADPDDPTTLRGRQKVSDVALIAATPEQDTPAVEVARAVGYSGAKAAALVKRCRRMNERAEAKGEAAPFVVTLRRGCSTLLRRAAP
jgi:hypothetical protein